MQHLNYIIIAALTAVNLFQFLAVPLWLLPQNTWWAMLLLPLGLSNVTLWSMIHEAIHKNLHPDTQYNDSLGRFLSIQFGTAFAIVRYGHMMHHRYNRDWENEYYDHNSNWLMQAPAYYGTLFAGLYLIEVVGSFAFAVLPEFMLKKFIRLSSKGDEEKETITNRFFFKRNRRRGIQQDVLLMTALYTLIIIAYAPFIWAFIILIGWRAFLISSMDNVYHYGTPDDNSVAGYDVAASRFISHLSLNMHYHATHHKHANIAWYHLPEAAKKTSPSLPFWRAYCQQFKGPIASYKEEPKLVQMGYIF